MEALVAGATAGAISNAILYPWERIKIQMQVTHEDQTHHTIKRTQGLSGFYSGLKPMVIGNALSYAIYFFVYEKIKVLFPAPSMLNSLASSAIAGAITSVFVNPFWMLQTKLALSKQNKGFFGTLAQVMQKEGLNSLWKGLSTSLILVSNPIIQFCMYEWLIKVFAGKSGKTDLLVFLLAAIAKAVATVLTYPYTTIRTFQHLRPPDKTWLDITKQMVHKEGFRFLFKGMSAKLIQTMLNAAFIMVIYERIIKLLVRIAARAKE